MICRQTETYRKEFISGSAQSFLSREDDMANPDRKLQSLKSLEKQTIFTIEKDFLRWKRCMKKS
jgi:hypothetical protein